MYIPQSSTNLKDQKQPRIFLGLQGASGSGKTTSAMTFPNPFVMDVDGSMTAFYGQEFPTAPFYSNQWCIDTFKLKWTEFKTTDGDLKRVLNKRDAIKKWLTEHATGFKSDQTLVVDSWTAIQDAFDMQTECEPIFSEKTGKEEVFAFWARKIEYSRDLLEFLRGLECNVIVTFHESQAWDKATSRVTEKLQPLQQGQFVAKIKNYFSDFYRQKMVEWDEDDKPFTEQLKLAGVFKEMFNKLNQGWFWQIKSGKDFDAKSRMPARPEILVPANFKSFNYANKL